MSERAHVLRRPEWVGEGSKRDVGGWIYCYFEESKPEVSARI